MASVQVLHCGDLHLDKNFNIPNLVRVLQRKEDLNNNFSCIVEYAVKNKPDLFIISGDVFDNTSNERIKSVPNPRNQTLTRRPNCRLYDRQEP